MVHVLATIELHPGKRAEFIQKFLELVPLVHAEVGCLEYGPTVDVSSGLAAQKLAGPDTVVVVEKWTSLAALESHLRAPHMEAFRSIAGNLIQQISIQVLEPAQ